MRGQLSLHRATNTEEEEERDKGIEEDKKTACVSSESQARGAHVLFQGSALRGGGGVTWAASV